MTSDVAGLYQKLTTDSLRADLGFSSDFHDTNEAIVNSKSHSDAEGHLAAWLHRSQPCLFGRVSAKLDRIHYCVLMENDLLGDDESIKRKIQQARRAWTRAAFEGRKSAFVVLAASEKLAHAAPDISMNRLAQRLCSLYLLEENIANDVIYTDEVFLEKPDGERATWKWLAGVNFFAAAGDRRWWQDHRVPGGIGFSVNSVGHLVKSGALLQELNELIPESSPLISTKIESLEKALEFAMRTIWNASTAASGKATELLPLGDTSQLPVTKCPAELPRFLQDKNYCAYRGYYHTDVTLPSDYFLPDVTRSNRIAPVDLDFTYLFGDHVDNPAYDTMGMGLRIRGGASAVVSSGKLAKAAPASIPVSASARLSEALSN